MARKRAKVTKCPNCGHALVVEDNYCGRCGQENHTHKLPIRHFLVELLSGVFNFDTKLLRTLRDLFWPPGRVIREYNANKRAGYVPPLRLYLFTSVLFFILLAWTTDRLDISEKDVVSVNKPGEPTRSSQGLTLDFGEDGELADSVVARLSDRHVLTSAAIDSALTASGIEPGFWSGVAVRMAANASSASKKANYVQGIFATFSKLMFVLLPLFAALLYLLHLGSGRYYTEHLVFALYFHTVLYMIAAARLIAGQVFDRVPLEGFPNLLALIYLAWAMRIVYQRPWWATILRTLLLILLYFVLLLLGFGAAAVIGAFGV